MEADFYDAATVAAIQANSIVGGHVNEAGQLVLERGNGEEFNAGAVVPDIDTRWPIDCIFISVTDEDPALQLGGGTWTRFAQGRTLVGVDEGDADFDTVLETRGEKTHTLTVAEIPDHFHVLPLGSAAGSGVETDVPLRAVGPGDIGFHNSNSELATTAEYNSPLVANGQAHNNLQPLITVYMWRRTA